MSTTADSLSTLSGLEVMQRMAAGLLPPPTIATLLGMDLESVEDGSAGFVLTPDDRMLNPLGSVHGGIAATLLDSCMGCAVHTTLPPGADYTTAQLNVHYLRAMRPGTGQVRAVGTVLHRGRTQCTAEGRLLDSSGRLLAHATTTCLVRMP
ncbi:PaaI family thioesterase [Phycicoccus avicenniae]|uniref:PaaI family thioesterase n=1 Tax=Phycicoccus avicenniae TaxID=2828860 RepID=UPI003D269D69